MLTSEEIDKQIAELEAKKKELAKAEHKDDLATVKKLIAKHGFTAKMLKGVLAEGRKRRS